MTSAVIRKMGLKAKEYVLAIVPGHQAEPRAARPCVRGSGFTGSPARPMGSLVTAFDTRREVWMARDAANGITRRLRYRGYELVSPPAEFIVLTCRAAAAPEIWRGPARGARACSDKDIAGLARAIGLELTT